MAIQPKKINIIRFFNSEEWKLARVKMSAMYLLYTYANELKEDVENVTRGADGMLLGELKKKTNDLSRCFDAYDKCFRSLLQVGGDKVCDDYSEYAEGIDEIIKNNEKEIIMNANIFRVYTEKYCESYTQEEYKESDVEIISGDDRKYALDHVRKEIDKIFKDSNSHDKDLVKRSAEFGFNVAINWVNDIFLGRK